MKPGQALRAQKYSNYGAADQSRMPSPRTRDTFDNATDHANYIAGWDAQRARRDALRADHEAMQRYARGVVES